jgi:hypothetical protein
MKQKVIIGFSVAMLLLAVFLIARDLFHKSPAQSAFSCCGDDINALKQIDTSLVEYTRFRVIETGLKDLSGMAINEEQQIYVCGNGQVTVYDSTGKRIDGFTIDSSATCIALKGNDIYLGIGAHIGLYSISEKRLFLWQPFYPSGFITSVAVGDGFVYAADAASKRVLKYSTNGKFIQEIGAKDSLTGAPGIILPSLYFDIALDAFNDLWVVNPGMRQIENYTLSGHLQLSWGVTSTENNGFTGCCNPAQMAILPNGNFVTYEKGIDKIKVFDPTGQFQCFVGGAGSFKGNTDFQIGIKNLVKDMATDMSGNIYVLDAYNRVNVFRKNS